MNFPFFAVEVVVIAQCLTTTFTFGDIEMIKKTLFAAAMLAASSAAFAEISANVTLASDYIFRGISQTDNQLAIQGGFDYAWDMGFYVGTWASNVDSDFFNGDANGQDPQTEVDLYAGYSGEYKGFGYDVGYLRYEYPGFGDADTNEVYVNGSYSSDLGDFGVSINYSDELSFLPSDESAWYLAASYDRTLPWYEIGLSLHVGYNTGDAFDVSASNAINGKSGLSDSYTDWSIGVSKSWMGADYALTYTDLTDLKSYSDTGEKMKCRDDYCDSHFVASISKSF
jgi:uncharacterized protein (TIGR02001 family)